MFYMQELPLRAGGVFDDDALDLTVPAVAAQSSTLAELCTLLDITAELQNHQHLRLRHVRVHRDQTLYRAGQPFKQLYAVKAGVLKAVVLDVNGREQVVGFPMKGSLVGVDGIAYGQHMVEMVALCDSELIVMPMSTIRMLGRCCPGFSRGIYYAMSGELARELSVNMRRGLSTKARLGRFLLDLADRFAAMGYARSVFNLPMPRSDIGNYLGMAQETVSRALLSLEEDGLISLSQRTVCIHDAEALLTLKRLPRHRARQT
ncbi:Crp/Fnr family transcriptional regulator [Duganella aceris]|jgi:CRP/FNR family transcriptional regulator|uniref:Helix-turn-helix domain-containing protein n=1 Tax=Duganella aceris TaxID=2703883 RepID=A0ABX0FJP1_9BURK|nr:helix-turn-helix domain-containing protein [Duganella aceris]NGZ84755.1 helix-turn-helix domain-containing protein [Duganella aceris]